MLGRGLLKGRLGLSAGGLLGRPSPGVSPRGAGLWAAMRGAVVERRCEHRDPSAAHSDCGARVLARAVAGARPCAQSDPHSARLGLGRRRCIWKCL